MSRIPHCLDNLLTYGGKFVRPAHRPRSAPQNIIFLLLVLISVRDSVNTSAQCDKKEETLALEIKPAPYRIAAVLLQYHEPFLGMENPEHMFLRFLATEERTITCSAKEHKGGFNTRR
jgi:hypothetical protein